MSGRQAAPPHFRQPFFYKLVRHPLYLGFFIAFWATPVMYFKLIDSAGATNALLVTLLVPPFAILFGSLFLNEVLAPQDFIGLALIALGLAAIDGRLLKRLHRKALA